MNDRTVTITTGDHGQVTVIDPLWCIVDHSDPLAYRADIAHVGADHHLSVHAPDRSRELLSLSITQFPYSSAPRLRDPHIAVTLSSDYDPSFPCTAEDVERLAVDLLDAAGWVRRVGRRLTIEAHLESGR